MKAMLAKGFKKEKAQRDMFDSRAKDREYKNDDKHDHFDEVKQRKKDLDLKFNIKMNAVNKKSAQRQDIVNQNRMSKILSKPQSVNENVTGSNSQLESPYPMTTQQKLNYQSKIRMQSATTRNLEKIHEAEEIQVKLEEIQMKLAQGESKKYEELTKKV